MIEDSGTRCASGLANFFKARFGHAPEWLVSAPGRVNLIGDHTDHNGGFVLPMAIEKRTMFAAARGNRNEPPRLGAYSMNLDASDEFGLAEGKLERTGGWTDYLKGVCAEFLERGLSCGSLEIVVDSEVPMGCGLSSSAALAVATARLLQQLQPGLVGDAELAALCQAAEHRFAGVPVGIMDPYCIANAKQGHLVYLDCRTLDAEHVVFDDSRVAVLIVDSKASRDLRSGAYARRRAQCVEACEVLGLAELRDATEDSIEAAKDRLGERLYRRARHVTGENRRTTAAVTAIKARDWPRLGELMYESHDSLAQDFETSCMELDTLVDLASGIGAAGGVLGARMTGGGFGGCMVALIERSMAGTIITTLSKRYADATGKLLSAFISSPAAGARVLERHEWESP